MAQKVTVSITDDLTGEGEATQVNFGFDGVNYEIDLNAGNKAELEGFLARYIEAGRKTSAGKRGRPAKPAATPGPTGSGLSPQDRTAVREYAAANGVSLAQRGRLPDLAVTAWRTQNPGILDHLKVKQAAAV